MSSVGPDTAGLGADRHAPDERGRFEAFGGRYVSETLMAPLSELDAAFREALADPEFWREWRDLLVRYVGRPTPLTHLRRLSQELGGAQIVLKREDLCHTGAHKVNNTLGQCLLAKRMGKRKVVAETGAGQHGVATATAAALLGLGCKVYMGLEDVQRQQLNVFRMQLLGATVVPVTSGSRTLKDAVNESMRHWVSHVDDTYFCLGSVAGPHPYPWLVRVFQSVIGEEAREQYLHHFGQLPDEVVACVGGGSNAIGIFHPFRDDASVALVGVEAAGDGLDTERHAATLCAGSEGVLHGAFSYVLQDAEGQIQHAHSISAGLDYPGVGPEHAALKKTGRATYAAATDAEALAALQTLARTEGIIPALESAHAVAWAIQAAPQRPPSHHILVNCSGRGDKDMRTISTSLGFYEALEDALREAREGA
jgi:tryptophan synthase beta chain